MQDEFDLIASEEQIRKMNEEFDKLDRERKSSQSHLFSYPIPVYMTDKCAEFCKRCTAIAKIISSMDAVFISRNSEIMDFILQSANKNKTLVAGMANITGEIFVSVERMPIKQSMYKLLELHNFMSIILSELSVYDNSAQMQNIIQRHLLSSSILHGICI